MFFIDRVSNYRIYNDDGTTSLGKIGKWFEDAFEEIGSRASYKDLISHHVSEVHGGYFSQDKKGRLKDTRGNTSDDESTYTLIMRDKERLLDRAVPLRFIFSHSALREGWDNPNVFQICTLNETRSKEKKRQEVGRGLRLPVNGVGERVHDDTVNRLTVIANEAYQDFARALQTELEEDFGVQFGKVEKIAFARFVVTGGDGKQRELGQDASNELWEELVGHGYLNNAGEIQSAFAPQNPHFVLNVSDKFTALRAEIIDEIKGRIFENRVVDVRQRRELKFQKEVHLGDDFAALWERIKHWTRYRVTFDSGELITRAVGRIVAMESIRPPKMAMTKVGLRLTKAGVDSDNKLEEKAIDVGPVPVLPDILGFLQMETKLTRRNNCRNSEAVWATGRVQTEPSILHERSCSRNRTCVSRPYARRH